VGQVQVRQVQVRVHGGDLPGVRARRAGGRTRSGWAVGTATAQQG